MRTQGTNYNEKYKDRKRQMEEKYKKKGKKSKGIEMRNETKGEIKHDKAERKMRT